MVLLIVASVAGIFLGLYYNLLVLVPVTMAAAVALSAVALWHAETVSTALFAIAIPAIGLQGGYMIGLTSRDVLSQFLSRLNAAQSKRV
jgi:transaldolase